MADNRFEAKLGLNTREFDSKLRAASGSMGQFASAIGRIGGVLAATFSVAAITKFTAESIKLAAQAEGIKAAFDKLNNPNLLADLQRATRGTVDNMTLMQKAVQANNFKIPLSQLATYFEFATKRAIETGQSVDYLVDSIITGVGRKSVLVMDNLGISAVELQEEVKKVGDFGVAAGNIIQRELGNMGAVADTAAVRFQTFRASVTNLKTSFGEFLNNATLVKNAINGIANALQDIADRGLLNAIFESKETTQKRLAEIKKWDVDSSGNPIQPVVDDVAENIEEVGEAADDSLKSISELVEEIKLGAEESRRMAEAWKIVKREIAGTAIPKADITNLKIPTLGGMPSLPGLQGTANKGADALQVQKNQVVLLTDALYEQQEAVNILSASFSSLFLSTGNGFQAMIDTFIDGLKRLMAELLARAAVMALFNMIPGAGLGGLLGGAATSMFGNMGAMNGINGLSGQNINLGGELKVKGRDMALVLRRNI